MIFRLNLFVLGLGLIFTLFIQTSELTFGATRLFSAYQNYSLTPNSSLSRGFDSTSITKDGRFVVFATHQNNIINGIDNNNQTDVYLIDLLENRIVLVSRNFSNPNTPADGTSDAPSLSEVFTNRIRVAFRSTATNIIDSTPTQHNGKAHIYVREYDVSNLSLIDTYIVSKLSSSSTWGNADSDLPKISGNGEYVVFHSNTNFVITDTGGPTDVYRKTLPDGDMVWASHKHNNPNNPTVQKNSGAPSISYDGTKICFTSESSNLDPDYPYDFNQTGKTQVYLWTQGSPAVNSISRIGSNYGDQSSGSFGLFGCDVTDSGNVTFQSSATNFITPNDTDGMPDIFLRTSTSLLEVSKNSAGQNIEPNITRNGRFIAFQGTNSLKLYDVVLNSVRTFGSGDYSNISETGRFVIFRGSSNLVGDTNNRMRPIIHDWVAPAQLNLGEFNGDGVTDLGLFNNGTWKAKFSPDFSTEFVNPNTWGQSTDVIVPGDYFDLDGLTDYAVFRPSNGIWYIMNSSNFVTHQITFGSSGDTPVPIDYDSDNKTDIAVYRPDSQSLWYIQKSTGGVDVIPFGVTGDKPVVGDYNGDNKGDIAIFRPNGTNGAEWWIRLSPTVTIAYQFGNNADIPVQSDYTGDTKTDVAIFRPSNGDWYILRSEDSTYYSFPFGVNGDLPTPGDYDNDGKTDGAVFRPSNGTWYANRTTLGVLTLQYGTSTDKPIPNAFVP